MYKMLIVDDEQLIVDWLYRLFGGLQHLELDLYKAYTGEEALGWLNRTKIDIVLTDIHMPEMNGIQLLENIKSRWPECRVVFLTGYNEFEYVYSAIRYEGVSYLLKTEGDAEIVAEVEKAVGELEKSFHNTEFLSKAAERISKALPLLQREYLTALLRGERTVFPVTQEQLDELQIPLRAELPLLVLLGRMDHVSRKLAQSERSRLMYTAKNLIDVYMADSVHSAFLIQDDVYAIWLLQPKEPEPDWERTRLFVRETLDTAQRACTESLSINMSFALAGKQRDWSRVPDGLYGLKQLLNCRVGPGGGLIVTESGEAGEGFGQPASHTRPDGPIHSHLGRIGKLENCLERGEQQEFFELFADVEAYLQSIGNMRYLPALEVYFSVSTRLLSCINRRGLASPMGMNDGLERLTNIERFDNWTEATDYLRRTAAEIFRMLDSQQESREKDTVMLLQQYILDHLAEDISLVKLGELSHFNPSYLSRLFKKVTGTNISDLIHQARINKAKELLGETNMKIHEVAAAVGFDSPAYFSKFFKKSTQLTPQEYRDSLSMM